MNQMDQDKFFGFFRTGLKVKIGSMVKNTNYFRMLRPNSEFSVSLEFSLFDCQKILELCNTRTPMSTLSVSFCLTLLPKQARKIATSFCLH
jgi:hypothetical protein